MSDRKNLAVEKSVKAALRLGDRSTGNRSRQGISGVKLLKERLVVTMPITSDYRQYSGPVWFLKIKVEPRCNETLI